MIHNRYLQRGGEDQSTELEVELLRSKGNHVELLVEDNVRVAEIGRVRAGIRATWSREAHSTVARRLDQESFDLVHVQNFFPLLSPSVHWAARAAGVPVVQSIRNYRLHCANGLLFRDGAPCSDCLGRPVPWPAVAHACYQDSHLGSGAVVSSQVIHRAIGTWRRCVDAFITLTEFSRNLLVSSGVDSSRVHVKPNFLSPDPGPGPGGTGFLFVGRLSDEKGLSTLLEAWERLSDREIRLEIVGTGPLEDYVARNSDRFPNVRWTGALPHDEVIRRMGRVRAVIVPSLSFETFGRVGMEAFARGTPAIVSRHGALEELVEHEKTGLHFEPGDPADLARQVERLHHGPEAWMRSEARNEYLARYEAQQNYARLMQVYASAAEVSRRSS